MSKQFLDLLNYLAIIFPAFLFVFTVRGFFKALAAKIMGDDTVQQEGFLSLNPLVHIDFFGLITTLFIFILLSIFLLDGAFSRSMLIIFLVLLGVRWTIPVDINESNFKNYTLGVILTTLSGSIGSFFLALVFLYLFKYFPFKFFPNYVFLTFSEIFGATIELAVFFGVLDLIPIPPFSGGRLLEFILPKSWHNIITWLHEYSVYILLALFILPGISEIFFSLIYLLSFFVKRFLLFLVF
ncbi:site-2 protease family protein [Candidatus Babeliales bacterium]|nr:site-2 protease family protein [Candidatus Babeliales bacterium]MCF7899646.1 site-2 protease family protein [Candidatus Babeliales bacterium]